MINFSVMKMRKLKSCSYVPCSNALPKAIPLGTFKRALNYMTRFRRVQEKINRESRIEKAVYSVFTRSASLTLPESSEIKGRQISK